ncbi:hypothetical protein [Erwinia rhapontici]|uniref:hypothetical protein n=1 Tax=Erwinia rhapontici TaxID=55212 RepID=UPI003BA18F28
MMKIELTIKGKPVDTQSPRLSERLSAKKFNQLISETANVIEHKKQMEEQSLNDAIREVKLKHGI